MAKPSLIVALDNVSERKIPKEPHPDLKLALKRLQECNVIKYAAYRTAAKLRVLQRSLFMDQLPLRVISGVFERHQLQCTENSVHLDCEELDSVLSDIYFVIQREYVFDLEIDHASKLMIDFLLGVFDKKTKNSVQVLCTKIGLTVLCDAKPREKYQYLFEQLADHNNCLTRKKLEILLKKMINITEYLNEGLSFSPDLIPGTVESCFKHNTGTVGISENVFITWLLQDPQLLVWLSTLYRMQISEMICHGAKCAVCKIYPIIGLRYRCLRCLSYNQCQTCFFIGKLNKKHKLKHPVQEYCCQVTSRQSTKAFLVTLRNKLRKADSKLQYLPAQKMESNRVEALGDSTRLLDEMEMSSRTVVHGSRISLQINPQRELHSIILHLEQENKQLLLEIESLCCNGNAPTLSENGSKFRDCLLDHRAQVETQVQRLKLLKNYLISQRKPDEKEHLESTPVVMGNPKHQPGLLRLRRNELDGISPITRNGEWRRRGKQIGSEKMIWDKYDMGNYERNTSWEEVRSPQTASQDTRVEDTERCASSTGSESVISTWIGGSVLRDLEHSSNRGFTWLQTDVSGKSSDDENKENNDEEQRRDQDKQALEDLHCDLEDILNKLQNLLTNNPGKDTTLRDNKNVELAAAEMESLLSGLIHGTEKTLELSEERL